MISGRNANDFHSVSSKNVQNIRLIYSALVLYEGQLQKQQDKRELIDKVVFTMGWGLLSPSNDIIRCPTMNSLSQSLQQHILKDSMHSTTLRKHLVFLKSSTPRHLTSATSRPQQQMYRLAKTEQKKVRRSTLIPKNKNINKKKKKKRKVCHYFKTSFFCFFFQQCSSCQVDCAANPPPWPSVS